MTNDPLISVANLTKRFGRRNETALNNLSFDLLVGGVTGLVGPDGAGKTTLLRVLAGLLTRTKGELRVCGFDPQKMAHNCMPNCRTCHKSLASMKT